MRSKLSLKLDLISLWLMGCQSDIMVEKHCLHSLLTSIVSVLLLVNYAAETFSWGSKQYVSLWRSLDESVEIRNDEQLLEQCEMNLQHGTMHINAQINDFDGPL
jgi:hypothetical protein